jgi:hypothetical protein
MPQSIPAWTTDDGKVHTDYLKSLKHELVLFLSKVGENDVGARKIAESLTAETITPFTDLLEKIEDELSSPSSFAVVRG